MTKKIFQIYLKGEDRTNSVQEYKHVGSKIEVIFNDGRKFSYNTKNVQVVESQLNDPKSLECFSYLKKLAEEIGLKAEVGDGRVINILEQNYAKIDFVDPKSVLASFLSGNRPESRSPGDSNERVYPFGFNASQKDAVDKALLNQLSVIEGPPGTGKTQTILNIIANVIMRGESVAVVSSNNSAIKNVFEKLEKTNLDFVAAFLGNSTNKRDFIETQKPLPEMNDWHLNVEARSRLNLELKHRHTALEDKLNKQNELSLLRQELAGFELEQKHFLSFAQVREIAEMQNIKTSQKALDLWLLSEVMRDEFKRVDLWSIIKRFINALKFWDRQPAFIQNLLEVYPGENVLEAFQRRFYELKIQEIGFKVEELKAELLSFDFVSKMSEYRDISLQIFRATLAERYRENDRPPYQIEDLQRNAKRFIEDYPLILSTTYSLRSSLSDQVKYDYVIIDESSQVDVCTGALALSCARNAVIVGDLKQLSHVVDSQTKRLTDSIFNEFALNEAYRYSVNSLLSAAIKLYPHVARTLLREHYRCHPKIIEFCNKKFYNNELIILTEEKPGRAPLMVYKTVEGNHARERVNQRQIDVIKQEIIPDNSLSLVDGTLGIITPYRNQTNALQKAFEDLNVKADTVDKFQGQENSVVILSTVDNEISDFTDNANRLNVAISRAIDQLIVVINEGQTLEDRNIGALVSYIEYNNFSVVKSKVQSVFDYLFKSYGQRRKAFLAKHRRVSRYESENLIYAKLQELLIENSGHCLDVAVHVPLRMIIRDVELLNVAELKYAMHSATHVDFLIYDNVSKVPKLVIEVDGVSFHKEGTRQAERDAMKNEILKKYDLPMMRLRTDESGEDQRLREVLNTL